MNSFFPDREIKRFDILTFVQQSEDKINAEGGNEGAGLHARRRARAESGRSMKFWRAVPP